jgi:hypothetical protein
VGRAAQRKCRSMAIALEITLSHTTYGRALAGASRTELAGWGRLRRSFMRRESSSEHCWAYSGESGEEWREWICSDMRPRRTWAMQM